MSTFVQKTDYPPCSCTPEIDVHEFHYLWVISDYNQYRRNFRKGTSFSSPTFSAAANCGFKWCLKLYPNDDSNNNDDCSNGGIYLQLDSTTKCKTVFVEATFTILKENETTMKTNHKRMAVKKFELGSSDCWGFGDFIKNDQSDLSSIKKLMIHCGIKFSVTLENLSIDNSPKFCLSEDLGQLFKNEEFTDVVVSVKHKEYRAHKLILTSRSPVFANMFKHEMKESQENKINITDLDEETVEEMLNYIYTSRSEKLETLADKLLVAAEKYSLDELKYTSEKVLIEKLSVENVIDTLILADLYSAHKLKSNCINFIVKRSVEVMQTSAWKNIAPMHPEWLMEVCEAFSRQPGDQKGSK